jgi:hypothetical protein
MKSQILSKAIIAASLECLRIKKNVDVYKDGELFNFKACNLRYSNDFEKRCSYEKGKVKITDKNGKISKSLAGMVKKSGKSKKNREIEASEKRESFVAREDKTGEGQE